MVKLICHILEPRVIVSNLKSYNIMTQKFAAYSRFSRVDTNHKVLKIISFIECVGVLIIGEMKEDRPTIHFKFLFQ